MSFENSIHSVFALCSQNQRLEYKTQKLCLVFVEQMKQPVHQIHHFIIHIKLPEHLVIINEPVKLSQLLQRSKTRLSSLSISRVKIAKPTVYSFTMHQLCFWIIVRTLLGFIYETNINDSTERFLKHYF